MNMNNDALQLEHALEKLEALREQRDLLVRALSNALDGVSDHHMAENFDLSPEEEEEMIRARNLAQRVQEINDRAETLAFG